jgi:hypothetical protein
MHKANMTIKKEIVTPSRLVAAESLAVGITVPTRN